MKLSEKVAFYLPNASRKVELVNFILTQPWAHLLGHFEATIASMAIKAVRGNMHIDVGCL